MPAIYGVVQGNVVLLPEDVNLPDGATVEVLVMLPSGERADDPGVDEHPKLRQHRSRPKSLGVGTSGYADTAGRTAEEHQEPRPWR